MPDHDNAALAGSWQAVPGTQLSWRDWDEDEVAVYSHNLGHSYLLSAATWQVIGILLDSATPLSLAALSDQLLPHCPAGTRPVDILTLLAEVLPELQRIGLAQPAP